MRENNHDAIAIGHSRADPGIPEQLSTPSAVFQSKTPFQAFLKLEEGS